MWIKIGYILFCLVNIDLRFSLYFQIFINVVVVAGEKIVVKISMILSD